MARKKKDIDPEKSEDGDLLRYYMRDISKVPLLTAEREKELGTQVQAGSEAARSKLIQANLRYVIHMALKFRGRGMDFEDLISAGNEGLIAAVDRFDPEKGFRFSTYATWWIRQALQRVILNESRLIRMPVHIHAKYNAFIYRMKLMMEGQGKSLAEVAEVLEISMEEAHMFRAYSLTPLRADAMIGPDSEESYTLEVPDHTTCPVQRLEYTKIQETLAPILECLNDDEKLVVLRRFEFDGEENTLQTVADEMGVTREWVRQLQLQAMKKLKTQVRRQGLKFDDFF